jgi:hypothetical protein
MLFYICSWGTESPWTWAQGKAQLWRIDADISLKKDQVDWTNVVQRFSSGARHAVFSAPNSWNDPDMLEVGNRGLNPVEAQTHFSMWAISAAPLWAGNDLTQMGEDIKAIYTNPEVIAVDQDPLGAGVAMVRKDAAGLQVWSKPLGSIASGRYAVLFLNLTSHPATVAVSWRELALSGDVRVRDLYLHRDLNYGRDGFRADLPPHGSLLLKVTGVYDWSKGALYEAEWPGNIRSSDTTLLECPACSKGYAISLPGPNGVFQDSSLTFTQVVVPATGTYQIELNYAESSTNTAARLRVNEDQPVPVHLYHVIHGVESIPVTLHAGENSLTFSYAGANDTKANIDAIRIYRLQPE